VSGLRALGLAGLVAMLTACPTGSLPIHPGGLGGQVFSPRMDFGAFPAAAAFGAGWAVLLLPVRERQEKEIPLSRLAEELEVGDIATIHTKRQKTQTFRIYRVGPQDFWGATRDGQKFQVPYRHLVRVTVEREQGGQRVVLVLSIDAPPRPSLTTVQTFN
jgi:hypothetical protein